MNQLKRRFKGELDALGSVAFALVTLAILGGVGILISDGLNSTACNMATTADCVGKNTTPAMRFVEQILDGYSTLGDFIPIVVIALIGVILISYFRGKSE